MASKCVGVVLKPYYMFAYPVKVTLVTLESALSTPHTTSTPLIHHS